MHAMRICTLLYQVLHQFGGALYMRGTASHHDFERLRAHAAI